MTKVNHKCYLAGGHISTEENSERKCLLKFESRIECRGTENVPVEQLFKNLLTATVFQASQYLTEKLLTN